MSPPALIVFEDGLTQKWSNEEWQGFTVYSGENPNFLVKKAATISRTSVNEESFRMVLPLAMSPPRDKAVPVPVLPQPMMKPKKKLSHQESMLSLRKTKNSYQEDEEEEFKCNAFCLSFPTFGRSPRSEDSMKKKMVKESSFSTTTDSLSPSFEKFECGSWASTTALPTGRMYFDLPMEMIRCEGGDVQEPVSLGFFFEKESRSQGLKSVLKTSSSQRRVSAETSSPQRRVRFSTTTSISCPNSPRSFMSPRLLKARDDFNTFLAAQNE